jgi:hypothetical protein
MKTLKKPISQSTKEQLTLFPEDSHANLSLPQEKEKERQTTASSGRRCLELYGKFNPDGSLLKTFLGYLLKSEDWYSSAYALIWKVQGTKYSRLLFRLALLEQTTGATGFSLLPTPTAMMPDVADLEKLNARREKSKKQNGNNYGFGMSLPEMLRRELLPTHMARDYRSGAKLTAEKHRISNEKKRSVNLTDYAASGILPTRNAASGSDTTKTSSQNNSNKTSLTGEGSLLNPLYVCEMMGFPICWTVLPFLPGEQKVSKDLEMR